MRLLTCSLFVLYNYNILFIVGLILSIPSYCHSQNVAIENTVDSLGAVLEGVAELEERHPVISDIIELTKFENTELSIRYSEQLLKCFGDRLFDRISISLAKSYRHN